MARISLRSYCQEIDGLIDQERLDEAIAHCRNILHSYPKHIDTYRLLGKAYLEAKRFGDAGDVFQRLLSAIPDDFISHIGMSIIREDEGNLDAAIWHMERSFESNPSNPAIQQELRRLIGKRDGFEPQKVRLTRGSLARMYARGELYDQAVAELGAALKEDPERPDLQVLLAEMYWRLGQHAEAAQVASTLLEELPYCRDANRIMAAILQEKGETEEATPYYRKVTALDPYAAHSMSPMGDPEAVDEDAVGVERVQWEPGQLAGEAEPRPHDWVASLGRKLAPEPAAQAEATPSAMPSMPAGSEEAGAPAGRPTGVTGPAAEGESQAIPSWMSDVGWTDTPAEAKPQAPFVLSDETSQPTEGAEEEEAVKAELPDWLKSISPPQLGVEAESGKEGVPEPAPLPDWLTDIAIPGETDVEAAGAAGPAPVPPFEQSLESAKPGDEALNATPAETPGEPTDVPPRTEEPAPASPDALDTWLSDSDKGRSEEPELPWEGAAPESAADMGAADEAWQRSIEAEAAEIGKGEEAGSQKEGQATSHPPAWLPGVAEAAAREEAPSDEELAELRKRAIAATPEEPLTAKPGETPDWLAELTTPPIRESHEEVPIEEEPSRGETEGPIAEEPDEAWLQEFTPEAREARGLTPEPEEEPLPEDLRKLFHEELAAEEPPSAETGERRWLEGPVTAAPGEEPTEAHLPPTPEATPGPAGPDQLTPAATATDEENLDWLERLSQSRGIEVEMSEESEEESMQPEEEPEVPDWLREFMDKMHPETAKGAPPFGAAAAIPDWMQIPQPAVSEPGTEGGATTPATEALEVEGAVPEGAAIAAEPAPVLPPEAIRLPAPVEPSEVRGVAEAAQEGAAAEALVTEAPALAAEPAPTPFPETIPPPAPVQVSEVKRGPALPSVEVVLDHARQALESGNAPQAAIEFGKLVKHKLDLPAVIIEVKSALDRNPNSPELWQVLGDAYMKVDLLPQAIEAYRRGLDTL